MKTIVKGLSAIAALATSTATALATDYWVIENQSDRLFRINMNTLVATEVGPLGVDWSFGGLGFAPDGSLYGWNTATNSLYRINTNTGAATLIGAGGGFGGDTFEINSRGEALVWEVDGEIYNCNLSNGSLSLRTTTVPVETGTNSAFGRNPNLLFNVNRSTDRLKRVDINTGTVTDVGALGLSVNVTNLGFNPTDSNLYAIEILSATYSVYRINPATGAATNIGAVTGMPNNAAQQVTAGTFQPPPYAGEYWVIENQSDHLFRIDIASRTAFDVGPLGVNWGFGGLGFAPNGTLYGWNTATNSLYTINQNTGAATLVGAGSVPACDTFDINLGGEAIAWSVGGEIHNVNLATGATSLRTAGANNGILSAFGFRPNQIYQIDRGADVLNRVNINTGAVTTIGPLGLNTNATNLGFNFNDGYLYAIEITDANYPLYRIDPVTGAATNLGGISGMPNNGSQQVTAGTFRFRQRSSDDYWVIDNVSDTLFRVDVSTREAFPVGPLGLNWGFGGLGFTREGALYGWNTATNSLYRINTATGAATLIGAGGGFGADTFDINRANNAIAWEVDGDIHNVNLATGALTLRTGGAGNGVASAFGRQNRTIFNLDRGADQLRKVNIDTGAATVVGPFGIDISSTNAGYNFNNRFLYAVEIFTADPVLYRINAFTGNAVNLGPTSGFPGTPQVTAGTFRSAGTCSCETDCDGNCIINSADVGCFLTLYFRDLTTGSTNADYDENGTTNSADVGAFLTDYFREIGPCY